MDRAAAIPEPIRALLSELFDYAGLFPPASLDIESAAANFARYRAGEHGWMLGRFVARPGVLEALKNAVCALEDHEPRLGPWRVSVTLGTDVAALESIRRLQAGAEAVIVDAVELKADSPEQVAAMAAQIPENLTAYFEIPASFDAGGAISAVAAAGARAKIRTGGVTADAFPGPREVARFIAACAEQGAPFKATAGLHHLVRGRHPASDDPESESCTMHGFLNLLIAAAFVHSGMGGEEAAAAILEEESASAFRFDHAGVAWRDWRLPDEQLHSMRSNLLIAIGSCSFEEPVRELQASGLL